jgi:hypothetical protein
MMVRIATLTLLLAAAPFARAQEDAPAAIQGPRITSEEPTFDFGHADNQQVIEHTFVVKNIGDTTLEITQVRPTCGCTVANVTERMVPPGGESRLTAKLSLQGRTGLQSKAIVLHTTDPENPQYRLTLTGTAVQSIMISPERLNFGQLGPGQEIVQYADLASFSDQPFNLLKVESTDPHLTATVEVLEPGKRYRVAATLKGPFQPGPMSASLRLTTDHPQRPQIELPASANVVGEIIYAPSELALPAPSADAVLTRYVVLRPGTLGPFEVKSVLPPDPNMRINVFPFGDQGYRIQIANIISRADLEGQMLRIVTSGTQMENIDIPLRIGQP